jgi:ADP-ribose pyrophosphatase YjhB (NUDIX family)
MSKGTKMYLPNNINSLEIGEKQINKQLLLDIYAHTVSSTTANGYPKAENRMYLSSTPLNHNGHVQFDNNGPWVAGELYPTHTEKYSDVLQNYGYPKFCELDADYRPLHPWWKEMAFNPNIGGVIGKGFFYHWGANYASDPAIFASNNSGQDCLLLVQRKDTRQWALPGGFVEPDETSLHAAVREATEETSIEANEVINYGQNLYSGPVLDPRTTLHAWIETDLWYFQTKTTELPMVQANDDAQTARWFNINEIPSDLYGSHPFLIDRAIRHHVLEKAGHLEV